MNDSKTIAALVDAVLALYDKPEPYATDLLDDINTMLHSLASNRRWESLHGGME